jgi:hypothetical protein
MNTVPTAFDPNRQVVADRSSLLPSCAKQAAPSVFKAEAEKLRSDPDPRSSALVPVPAKKSKRR